MKFVRLVSLCFLGAALGTFSASNNNFAFAFEAVDSSAVIAAPPSPFTNNDDSPSSHKSAAFLNVDSMAEFKQQLNAAFLKAKDDLEWTPEQLAMITGGDADSASSAPAELADSFSSSATAAPATAAISSSFFNRILTQIATIINDAGKKMTIPGDSAKNFGYSTITFSQFSVNSITFVTKAPNQLAVSINGLTISIPNTGFWVKALVKCKGHFSASVQGATIAINLALGNDGKGHITSSTTVSANFNTVSISHKFNSVLCKVANAVVKLLIGNIDKKIASAIKTELPKALGPAIGTALSQMFVSIPLYFTGTPAVATNQGFSVTVDLLGSVKMSLAAAKLNTNNNNKKNTHLIEDSSSSSSSSSPLAIIQTGLESVGGFDKDISIAVPQTSLNNIMAAAFAQGKFSYTLAVNGNTTLFKAIMPNAYAACPACKLVMGFSLSQSPAILIANNDVDASVRGMTVAFFGHNAAANTNVPLFVMGTNISVDLDQLAMKNVSTADGGSYDNLYFQLGMKTLDLATQSSSVGPLPALDIIAPVVTFCVKSLAIPAFNSQFTGFPFPPIFNGASVTALQGVFNFSTNLAVYLG